jgi:cytochrome P450
MSGGAMTGSPVEFWMQSAEQRDELFGELRRRPMLSREPLPRPGGASPEAPYWSVVRYDDVWLVSRRPDVFVSRLGTVIDDDPPEFDDFFGSMLNMDDPVHARLRSIVARAFGPKQIAALEQMVRTTAREVVDAAIEEVGSGDGDFVELIAQPFPLTIIMRMLGVPASDHALLRSLTDEILGLSQPEGEDPYDTVARAGRALYDYAQQHAAEHRRRPPTDDVMSVLVHAEVEGQQLTAQEFGAFTVLLVVAGNETTRTAVAHGMDALTRFPDQRDLWFGSFDEHARTAVDEIVRWATPVTYFRRTAAVDTVVGETPIAAGDRLVMWYCSANRDETVFADPHRFDIRRGLQPMQVGFGGGGPHFCLGANLARAEIRAMFEQIATRLPHLRTGRLELAGTEFVHGARALPCTLGPAVG